MKDSLVRFGVAMEASLLAELDRLVAERGGTRSELLRDLVRSETTREKVQAGASAVATLTLVYDHHVRDLTERLTDFQHALGPKVNSTLHVHLDHDHCLEVIVMRGPAHELKHASDKLLATRGVKHGGVEMIALPEPVTRAHTHAPGTPPHDHVKDHTHPRSGMKRKRATSPPRRSRASTS